MNQKKKEYELKKERDQAAEKLHLEAEQRAAGSPERPFAPMTQEDRVMRLRRYMESNKDPMMNLKTIRFDRDTHRTMYS